MGRPWRVWRSSTPQSHGPRPSEQWLTRKGQQEPCDGRAPAGSTLQILTQTARSACWDAYLRLGTGMHPGRCSTPSPTGTAIRHLLSTASLHSHICFEQSPTNFEQRFAPRCRPSLPTSPLPLVTKRSGSAMSPSSAFAVQLLQHERLTALTLLTRPKSTLSGSDCEILFSTKLRGKNCGPSSRTPAWASAGYLWLCNSAFSSTWKQSTGRFAARSPEAAVTRRSLLRPGWRLLSLSHPKRCSPTSLSTETT